MTIFRKVRFSRQVVLRMTATEQQKDKTRHMSGILWNLFTGSAPYREVFFRAFHPGFIFGLAKSAVAALIPGERKRQGNGVS